MSEVEKNFNEMGLSAPILKALLEVGYEKPSPIQAECIPLLLEDGDILGQAQTGTGKTAAFALPFINKIEFGGKKPKLLVLAPTRELAIQVCEAFQTYSKYVDGFKVLPVYGGQPYDVQIRHLKRGVDVVVGTPGRVMDHMRKGTLDLKDLKGLILDEADEMLRMGFIDDVEWVLENTPSTRQIALFSATMPKQIQRVAERFLKEPRVVKIANKTTTASTLTQRYVYVKGRQKLEALTRILGTEKFDAVIVFVRTKNDTTMLAEKLSARGYAAEALNGDLPQKMRETKIDQLKKGLIEVIVATDVAARGIDVQRITHVINYDIPYDTESYVHRVGRTGRAGRAGDAITFVTPREKRLLGSIEKVNKTKISEMSIPSAESVNDSRIARFKEQLIEATSGELFEFQKAIEEVCEENSLDPVTAAAALAKLFIGQDSFVLPEDDLDMYSSGENEGRGRGRERSERGRGRDRDRDRGDRGDRRERRPRHPDKENQDPSEVPLKSLEKHPDVDLERFIGQVGYDANVMPRDIVGALANEAGLDSEYIGHIEIYNEFFTVDLPSGMPKEIFKVLKDVRIKGNKMAFDKFQGKAPVKKNSRPNFRKEGGSAKPRRREKK
jgi:ATP-dependent RNA helicase DeaD